MLDFGFYLMDCLEGMKEFPDNYFDLAIVDPPYGAGFTESGGCKGWFSKYHQNAKTLDVLGGWETLEQIRRPFRQVQEHDTTHSDFGRRTRITRTGGTLAEKYSKKSSRGTLPPEENTLKNSFASHGTRLSGGGITLNFHRQDALLFGEN